MEKFEKTLEDWKELNRTLYDDCKEYLLDKLNKVGGEISINEDCSCCVNYDGGRHPEYDSNCFSQVESVYLKDGKIYLNTEDCYKYSIDFINADELCNVAIAVKQTIELDYDLND